MYIIDEIETDIKVAKKATNKTDHQLTFSKILFLKIFLFKDIKKINKVNYEEIGM